MPTKFIGTTKRENWDRKADRELKRRDKVVKKIMPAETRRRERAEASKWRREIGKEETRRRKVAAAGTRRTRKFTLKGQEKISKSKVKIIKGITTKKE